MPHRHKVGLNIYRELSPITSQKNGRLGGLPFGIGDRGLKAETWSAGLRQGGVDEGTLAAGVGVHGGGTVLIQAFKRGHAAHVLTERGQRLLGGGEVAGVERRAERLKILARLGGRVQRIRHARRRRNILKILLQGGKRPAGGGQVVRLECRFERLEILGIELEIGLDLREQGLQTGGTGGRGAGGTDGGGLESLQIIAGDV